MSNSYCVVLCEIVNFHKLEQETQSNAIEKLKDYVVLEKYVVIEDTINYKGGLICYYSSDNTKEDLQQSLTLANNILEQNWGFQLRTAISFDDDRQNAIAKAISLLAFCLPQGLVISKQYYNLIPLKTVKNDFQHEVVKDKFWREIDLYVKKTKEWSDSGISHQNLCLSQLDKSNIGTFKFLGCIPEINKTLKTSYESIYDIYQNKLITYTSAIEMLKKMDLNEEDELQAVYRADQEPGFWSGAGANDYYEHLKGRKVSQKRVVLYHNKIVDKVLYPSGMVLNIAKLHETSDTLRDFDIKNASPDLVNKFPFGITIIPTRKCVIIPNNICYDDGGHPILKACVIIGDLVDKYEKNFLELYNNASRTSYVDLKKKYDLNKENGNISIRDTLYDLVDEGLHQIKIHNMVLEYSSLSHEEWDIALAVIYSTLLRLIDNYERDATYDFNKNHLSALIKDTLYGNQETLLSLTRFKFPQPIIP